MRMRLSATIVASLFLAYFTAISPASAWNTSTYGLMNLAGIGGDSAYAIATDGSGNIYITGQTTVQIDLDPSPTSTAIRATNGGADVFIAKYTSSGDYIWGTSFGGSTGEIPYGMDVDSSGNVIITGTFEGTVDFDPGAGTANLTSYGNQDIFIVKFSTSGSFTWVKRIGSTAEDRATAITVDSNNNILVTGFFNQTIDFNPAPLETVTSTGPVFADIFVLKLDSNGLYQWAKQMGGSSADMGQAIATDGSDNVYVTGKYSTTVDFDPGAGTTNLAGGASGNAVFILKLTSTGIFGFAKSFANGSNNVGNSIKVDSTGNVYTTGVFQGTLDLDPDSGIANVVSAGLDDFFISKLNSSGNIVWAKSIGSTSYDQAFTLALDSSGDIYIGGLFYNTVDFNPDAGVFNVTSFQNNDAFIAKFSSAGEFVWATAFAGQGGQVAVSLELTSSGYILALCRFDTQIDFDPSPTVTYNYYPSSLFQNIFLARLAPDGTLSPATLIDKAIFNSLGISGGGIVATYRSTTTLSAEVNVAAKVSFLSNGKYVAGCRNLTATGSGTTFTVTCSWRPSARGSATITAVAVPTGAGISAGVSTPVNLVVSNRTTKR